MTYKTSTIGEIDAIVRNAQSAFEEIRSYRISKRVAFMRAVADEIEALGPELIATAMEETSLPEARLVGEKGRTIFQWRSYADAVERGDSLDASIDTANAERTPPKPDIRKTQVGLGPVSVFGASNFPFAFSTAGGDTAGAIAAGCTVIVKAHPGHPKTAGIMGDAILRAVANSDFPDGTFAQVYCEGYKEAQLLVSHPLIKAVGFTGSNKGGLALVEVANRRPEPIPVFAEMGSINPVFLLPGKLRENVAQLAGQYAGSLTLGVGQFCTNPGLLITVKSEGANAFIDALKTEIASIAPVGMLNKGIAAAYEGNLQKVTTQGGVEVIAQAQKQAAEGQGAASVATVSGVDFLVNDELQTEVFGPFGLIVVCKDEAEVMAVTEKLHGQLTATLLASVEDIAANPALIELIQSKCGRIMFNNFPTGVEVCKSMHHGGPFPSSSLAGYTSVGADSIRRFSRPLSFQSWPDAFLPEELQNENPLKIWRTVDNKKTQDAIG